LVLRRSQIALLQKDIGRGGSSQPQLLLFGIQTLLVVVPG
jgi:hypothetical protein